MALSLANFLNFFSRHFTFSPGNSAELTIGPLKRGKIRQLRWLEIPKFTPSTDFEILADVSIYETDLGRFRPVIFC